MSFGLGGGQIRPSWINTLGRVRENRGRADLSLNTYHERVGLDDPEHTATSVGLTAPATGSDVLIVNRALEEGSVVVVGDYEEGIDYEIVYGPSSTSLHNLAITPGTSLSVLYFTEVEEETGGGGGFPRSLVREDETVTIEEYEQMPVYQLLTVEGTLEAFGDLVIYE